MACQGVAQSTGLERNYEELQACATEQPGIDNLIQLFRYLFSIKRGVHFAISWLWVPLPARG